MEKRKVSDMVKGETSAVICELSPELTLMYLRGCRLSHESKRLGAEALLCVTQHGGEEKLAKMAEGPGVVRLMYQEALGNGELMLAEAFNQFLQGYFMHEAAGMIRHTVAHLVQARFPLATTADAFHFYTEPGKKGVFVRTMTEADADAGAKEALDASSKRIRQMAKALTSDQVFAGL